MKTRFILSSALFLPLVGIAADIEATFNDLNVGAPQTNLVGGANEGNTNTGTGFSDAGWDNPNTVLEILSDDLAIPGAVANYTANAEGGAGRRMGVINDTVARAGQLRSFTPLTGNTLWFSFLVRLDGTDAESHVVFNVNNNNNSGGAGGGFGVICGDNNIPGCLGLVTDTSAFIGSGTPPAGIQLYNPGGGTSNVLNTAGGTQLILGRLDVNDTGTDTLSIWLDPADAISPGAPTLSTTDEFVDAGGVANVSCEFVRRTANAGASIDHLRLSDSNTG